MRRFCRFGARHAPGRRLGSLRPAPGTGAGGEPCRSGSGRAVRSAPGCAGGGEGERPAL